MQEITTFVKISRRELEVRLDRKVPSVDEFGESRLGSTSAVYVTLAISEYVSRRMPPSGQFRKGLALIRYLRKFSWNEMHLARSIMEDEREYESSLEWD